MSVQEYLDKHILSRRIEDAVNAAVRAKSSDPILFISSHLRKVVPSAITKIKARQILDSRGIPTVEVDLSTNKGMFRASAPSGPSFRVNGAIELRDGEKGKYLGKGVSKAVENINQRIAEALVGMDPIHQSLIDQAMIDLDKTDNKAELGGNAMLAVSMAACKAGAAEKEVPLYKHIGDLACKSSPVLPVPAITMICGGKNAGNNLAVQTLICEKYGSIGCNLGEDGGLAPNISSVNEGLDLVKQAIDRAQYSGKVKIAMDIGATNFCIGKKYDLDFKSPIKSGKDFKTGENMVELYTRLCRDYPIVSVEEPFNKEDLEHTKMFSSLGVCQVVGDELLVSDPKCADRSLHELPCNALLLKMDEIGTVTEVIEMAKQARDAHWGVAVSHSSGETVDDFIADLAVGLAVGQVKTGAVCRGERISKYNQLLRIEEELCDQAVYAGENWRSP